MPDGGALSSEGANRSATVPVADDEPGILGLVAETLARYAAAPSSASGVAALVALAAGGGAFGGSVSTG